MEGGELLSLGYFSSKFEAALAYARRLGEEGSTLRANMQRPRRVYVWSQIAEEWKKSFGTVTACDDDGKVFKVAFDGGLGERRIHGSALHDITEPSSPPKKRKVTEVKQEVEDE